MSDGRVCTRCHTFKPWDHFAKNSKEKSGHASRCKSCIMDAVREKYKSCPGCSKQIHWKSRTCSACHPGNGHDTLVTDIGRECTACHVFKLWGEFAPKKGRTPARCRLCETARSRVRAQAKLNNVCEDCGVSCAGRWCKKHRSRGERNYNWKGGVTEYGGYRFVIAEHGNARGGRGRVAEHVLVMSDHIGRPLVKPETVHHKNGNRSDNRMSNLELWSKAQPAGQRVSDKIRWALELLALYGDDPERYESEEASS